MLIQHPDIERRFCQSSFSGNQTSRVGASQAIQWFAAKLACKDVSWSS
jgi:hypothetical protein